LRKLTLAFAALAILCAVPVLRSARAQQVASQFTCQVLLDGGASEVCGTIPTNFQPTTVTCEVSVPAASSAGTTVTLLTSGDGVHYGTWADAGQGVVTVANGGASGATTTVALALYPTNPWANLEVAANATTIDGGTGGPGALNCQISVINAQTLHSTRPALKAAKQIR